MLIAINGRKQSGKDTVGKIIQYLTAKNEAILDINMPDRDYWINISFEDYFKYNMLVHKWQIKKFANKLKDIICILINSTREQLEDESFKSKELGEEWWYWYMALDGGYSPIILDYLTTTKKELKSYEGLELIKPTPRFLLQFIGTDLFRNQLHPQIWVNSLMSEYKPIIQSTKEEDKRLLSIWKNMNTRCKNHNYEKYHKYGGKGITICKEWEDFQKFRFWALSNGYTNELTLDRINVNGNYEPSNCRFVTSSLQAFNKGSYHQGTSKLKGVNKYSDGRWQAQIQSKGIKKNLGYYQTEEEARKVYQREYDRINKELEEESFNLQRKCVYPNFIITDTRFENELEAVKKRKGITIRVNRSFNHKMGSKETGTINLTPEHESETALDNAEFDYVIDNNGTISELIDKMRNILIENKLIKNK